MRALAIACALLAGCIESDPDGVLPPGGQGGQTATPRACDGTISLYGMDGTAGPQHVIAAQAYDTAGAYFCLELDARDNIQIAHFAADTQHESGAASSFELTLYAADGTLLREGWDLNISYENTFASLEYGVTERVVLDTKLLVRAKSGLATSDVNLSLFEPYE